MRSRILLSCAGLAAVVASAAFAQSIASPVPDASPPGQTAGPDRTLTTRPPYVTPRETGTPTVASAQNPPQPAARTPTPLDTAKPAAPAQQNTSPPHLPYGHLPEYKLPDHYGSTYIPLDSWIYPAMTQLYGMGFANTLFVGMRPWTRRSVLHVLQDSEDDIVHSDNEQAHDILDKLLAELSAEIPDEYVPRGAIYGLESAYSRLMGIGGTTLRDSFHLGQTINNDYGRPYQTGFNNITGASTVNEWGRFSLYARAEYQHSPGGSGYPFALANQLSNIDQITYAPPNKPQTTIPADPVSSQNVFRLVEATAAFHWWGQEISGGRSDAWLGPAMGGAMAWSNNAENIYSFRINRVEPLNIFLLSKLVGPMRYDFFVGSLKGHSYPNSPWVHSEMFSFRPTVNFEFGFQRTVIWGGEGHAPVTLHSFLKSFFSFSNTTEAVKFSRNDPGARFSDFNFSYRLPYVRKYATLYVDSIAHDDVTPISAPRRASYRTGLYISQIPKLNRLDVRLEGVTTDPGVSRSNGGQFNYYEVIQRQGYTNKGYIMGDWIGREAKGGQAWLTYHLSGNEWLQVEYLHKKTPKDFIPDGTTQNSIKASVVKRLGKEVELDTWFQYEWWKAPIYKPGLQSNSIGTVQLTWYPKLRTYPEQH